jgi:hypothetical protein
MATPRNPFAPLRAAQLYGGSLHVETQIVRERARRHARGGRSSRRPRRFDIWSHFLRKPVATFPENALPRIVITLEVIVRA